MRTLVPVSKSSSSIAPSRLPMSRDGQAFARRRAQAVMVQLGFIFVLLAACLVDQLMTLPSADLIQPLCVVALLLFAASLWSWKRLTGRLFDPYGMFLIAASLFNAGQAYLEVFHLNSAGLLSAQFHDDQLLAGLFLVCLALAALHLGALMATYSEDAPTHRPETSGTREERQFAMRAIGWLLLCVSLPFMAMQLRSSVAVVLSSGYQALYQQNVQTGLAAGPSILAAFLVPGAFFLLAGAPDNKVLRLVSAASIAVGSFVDLFLGFRYYAAMPVIAYVWLWQRTVAPAHISRVSRAVVLGAGAVLTFFVFPLVGATRNISGGQRLSVDYLLHAFSIINNPIVALLGEMGGTLRVTVYTLMLIPSTRPFDWGTSYFFAMTTVAPNLFWSVHPAIAHGTFSDWLIRTVDPFTARHGGGLGYSFIAEAYANFGWFGAPIACAAIGYLYARVVNRVEKSGDAAKIAALAVVAYIVTRVARDESTNVVRGLFWYALAPYAAVELLVRRRIRSRPRARPDTRDQTNFSSGPTRVSVGARRARGRGSWTSS